VLAAACAPVLAYLVFIWHYAVNAPFADDWSQAPLVSDGLHHNIRITSPGQLWAQYSEARLVVTNVLVIGFGYVNRLNLRSVVLFSAFVFVATYFLMLVVLRRYLGRPLTFGPVFSLGVVWFSLAGVSNALWAFQLAWYLVLFFLFAAIFFLCVWPRHRPVALTLAIVAAILGSLSMVQGFLIWPTFFSRAKFWALRAPICRISAYSATSSAVSGLTTSVTKGRPVSCRALARSFSPSSSSPWKE